MHKHRSLFQFLWSFFAGLFALHVLDPGAPGAPSVTITPTDLRDERARYLAQIDDIVETARAENRSTLRRDEQAEHDELVARAEALNVVIERAEGRQVTSAAPGSNPPWQVRTEASTYRPDAEVSYFADVVRSSLLGDMGAADRLARHFRENGVEVSRDIGTTAAGAFVPPTYLGSQWAELARPGRPTADIVTRLPLPERANSVLIPRVTTGTAAAAQATENSAVQETNLDETTLTVPVRTYAGQQDVSRQLLDRSDPAMDQVIYADLAADYATKLNSGILISDGTSGTHLGITATSGIGAVTYTDGSPTVPEIWPKLANAVQTVAGARYQGATVIVMHPRRWGWFLAALDSSSRPYLAPTGLEGPTNSLGVGATVGYGEVVGHLQGLPVVTDASIPTTLGGGTEDIIIVMRAEDCFLWEEGDGSPRLLQVDGDGAGSLTVKLVVYGYSAFTAGRQPSAVCTVGGTGLAAPSW